MPLATSVSADIRVPESPTSCSSALSATTRSHTEWNLSFQPRYGSEGSTTDFSPLWSTSPSIDSVAEDA